MRGRSQAGGPRYSAISPSVSSISPVCPSIRRSSIFLLPSGAGGIIRIIKHNNISCKQVINLSERIGGYSPLYVHSVEEAEQRLEEIVPRDGIRLILRHLLLTYDCRPVQRQGHHWPTFPSVVARWRTPPCRFPLIWSPRRNHFCPTSSPHRLCAAQSQGRPQRRQPVWPFIFSISWKNARSNSSTPRPQACPRTLLGCVTDPVAGFPCLPLHRNTLFLGPFLLVHVWCFRTFCHCSISPCCRLPATLSAAPTIKKVALFQNGWVRVDVDYWRLTPPSLNLKAMEKIPLCALASGDPWFIETTAFDVNEKRLDIRINFKRSWRFR